MNKNKSTRDERDSVTVPALVRISDLWIGDHFRVPNDKHNRLWLLIGHDAGQPIVCDRTEPTRLADRGYGYIGASICCMASSDEVEFTPIHVNPSRQDQAAERHT